MSTSGTFSFTTNPLGDVTPPVISQIANTSTTASGTHITWSTNEDSTSKVWYGTSFPVNVGGSSTLFVSNSLLIQSHDITLSGLASGTIYYYVVESADASGNVSDSGNHFFVTLLQPILSGIGVTNITSSSAHIVWTTNVAADSSVTYSTSTPVTVGNSQTATVGALLTSHDVMLSSLQAGTTYHFYVTSQDVAADTVSSAEFVFTTGL